MPKAVVLVFLLDALPDLIINSTLLSFAPDANVESCEPTIAAPILEIIGDKFSVPANSIEKMFKVGSSGHYKKNFRQILSPETLAQYKMGTDIDNSIQNSNENSLEKSSNLIDRNFNDNVIRNEDISECEETPTDYFTLNRSLNSGNSFPESAPFLAAIFETLSNVTAQTCGGALVAPHWVLTAASCVNVLGPIFSNSSYETIKTSYTIVIGATNSLKDGSVHNVSKIILHPTPKIIKGPSSLPNHALIRKRPNFKRPIANVKTPSLALMRIEPGLEQGVVEVMESRQDWDGVNARVYGWALVQNESGHDSMLATSLPLNLLSPDKCKSSYGDLENNSTLCLSSNETSGNINRMNSGGPVLVLQSGQVRLLAVALTDGTAPLLASPLSTHRDWLSRIIGGF